MCGASGTLTSSYAGMIRRTAGYMPRRIGIFSTTCLTDAGGAPQQRFVYDPYGAAAVLSGSWVVTADAFSWRRRFTGQQYDAETQNYLYRLRYYSGPLGGFISRDPTPYSDGCSLYEYAGGRSPGTTDPLGLRGYGRRPIDPIGTIRWMNDGRSLTDGPAYGNWCGKNWSGGLTPSMHGGQMGTAAPIDSTDELCKTHDECYDKADHDLSDCYRTCLPPTEDIESPIGDSFGEIVRSCQAGCEASKAAAINGCNATLVAGLKALPGCPRNWPHPPPDPRMDGAALWEREDAIKFFSGNYGSALRFTIITFQ